MAIVVLLLVVVLSRIPSGYNMLLPSTALSVEPKIYVAGHPVVSGRGQLLMTFVEERHASLLENIFGRLDPDASFDPLPPNYDEQQNVHVNNLMMLSSEQTAELVALCYVRYKELCAGGVQIQKIEPYSKVGSLLKPGDLIVAVNGVAIATGDQLRSTLQHYTPGTQLTLSLQRGKATLAVKNVPTVRAPQSPYGTAFGIAIADAPLMAIPAHLPIDMKINAGDIGGPSAGLMFTLGVLNRLSSTDLTHGYTISGTGTISLDGSVGAIGGVKQKVIGAEWAGAKIFFVPYDGGNYNDAKKVVGPNMQLVGVHNLQDALSFLHKLR